MSTLAKVALVAAMGVCAASGLETAVNAGMMVGGADDGMPKLHKPVIVNPLETPAVSDNLAGISKILGAEPAAAADPPAEGNGDSDGEVEGLDDVALMGEDDCSSPLPSEKCKQKQEGGDESSSSEGSSSEAGAAEQKPAAAAAAAESSEESSESGAPADKTEAEIHSLEKLISSAMKISKAIPDKVKRLEQLKNKEEHMTEERARAEAENTLKEHARLLEEMKTHIAKLQGKLSELKQKRKELIKSDARLRATLEGKPVPKAESSAPSEESSEASKKEE